VRHRTSNAMLLVAVGFFVASAALGDRQLAHSGVEALLFAFIWDLRQDVNDLRRRKP
jgi:hypothetical protein